MYNTILFDLDGTLTDPGEGITNSVAYALEHYGIHNTDRRELYCFIGPPLLDSFRKFYGLSYEQAERGVNLYREYYRDRGIFENKVIPGIPALLEHLKTAGKNWWSPPPSRKNFLSGFWSTTVLPLILTLSPAHSWTTAAPTRPR